SGGELRKALASGAAIVGINNRDLQTFRTDIEISHDLAARIPVDKIAVSESGIRDRSDIEGLAGAGIKAFLIGETLVTAADPGKTLEGLLGQ
nr:indole-3-glycerol phosphate synthase [Deltaproteobacteria bacterium]